MRHNGVTFKLSFAFAVVILFATSASFAFAQSLTTGQGLSISPFLLERKMEKGQTTNEIIEISNTSDQVLPLNITINDFLPQGTTGQQVFLDSGQGDPHYSLSSWITIHSPPKQVLQPHEKTQISFSITPPLNADEGGHYGAILFSAQTSNLEGTSVAIQQKLGAIVLIKLGKAVEDGQISKFEPEHSYYNYPPVSFITSFKNSGNVHVKPRGSISIHNWFGRKIANVLVNENGNNVLAQTERDFTSTWKDKFAFGRYRAEVKLVYGDSGQVLIASSSFWVIPWKMTLGGAIGLFVLTLLGIYGVRKYNKWLIKKFMASRR